MTKIITVHGTFAGDDADEGDKWWQRGSEFLTELQEHIEEPLEIEPFHWSGNNSELDRRKAGYKLWEKLKDEEEPPIVIGHSHGGSVGIHAAAIAVLKKGEKAAGLLRGFLSIGTPMILFKGNRNPFTNFNILGRLLLLYALSLLTWTGANAFIDTGGGGFTAAPRSTMQSVQEFFALVPSTALGARDFGFWISAGIILILLAFNSRTRKRRKLFRKNGVAEIFGDAYIGLSHRRDEAINGLAKARTFKPKIFTLRSIGVGLFSFLSFGILLLDLSSDATYFVFSDDHYYEEVEGVEGLKLPQVYFSEDTVSGFRFPGVGETGKIFDLIGAQRYRVRKDMIPITFDELWQGPLAEKALAQQDSQWLYNIYNSVPAGQGVFFVETGSLNAALDTFDNIVAALQIVGRERYLESVVCTYGFEEICAGDAPITPEIEELAYTYHTLMTLNSFAELQQLLVEMDEENVPDLYLPPMIVANLPYTDLPAFTDQGMVTSDSFILAGKWSSSYSDTVCADADTSPLHCTIFYAGVDGLSRDLYRFGEHKYTLQGFLTNEALIPQSLSFLSALVPNYAFTVILIAATGIVGIILGLIVTPILGSTLTNSLRGKAFGNDGFGEFISDVKPSLNFKESSVGTLPDSVQEEMIQQSLEDAPMAISRLRQLMAGEGLGDGGVDPISVATKFEKSELIHNAYFHSPLFVRYVAATLVEKYGLTPSAKFKADLPAMTYRYTM